MLPEALVFFLLPVHSLMYNMVVRGGWLINKMSHRQQMTDVNKGKKDQRRYKLTHEFCIIF